MVGLIAAPGLRIGELLGLRWSALDLVGGTLSVGTSVIEGMFQPPKTQRARRTIPLGPRAVAVLTRHHEVAIRREPDDLVFGNTRGESLREVKLLQRVLQPAASQVGLGRLTWHQFRHIHSSLLNDLRVPAKIAEEQLRTRQRFDDTRDLHARCEHLAPKRHEAVEERLFVPTVSNCLESARRLETAVPATDTVN
jgi:integrase